MKFLFIIQGEGRGHITEAIALSQILKKNKINICCSLIGKSLQRKIPPFFYEQINSPIVTYFSPNFIRNINNTNILVFWSFIYNLFISPLFIFSIFKINKTVKKYNPDIIINFYDIIGGFYNLIFKPNKKFICIGHHYFMQHYKYEFPDSFFINKILLNIHTNLTSLKCYKKIGLSLYPAENDLHKNIYVAPPLIRDEILNAKSLNNDYFLVYLLNAGYLKKLIKKTHEIKDIKMYLFIDKKNKKKYTYNNLIINYLSYYEYIQILISCKGVITTAGFETPAEAIYLGKPLFIYSVGNHFEQKCNAFDIEKLNMGFINKNNKFEINKFFEFISTYKENEELKKWIAKSSEIIIELLNE